MKIVRVLLVIVTMLSAHDAFAAPKKKTAPKKKPNAELRLKANLKGALAASFGKSEINRIFSDSRLKLDKTITGQGVVGTPCSYFDPCFSLLTEESLGRGKAFCERNKEYFDKALSVYRVSPAVILGVLRVETSFGKYVGKRGVFNSLYSAYVLIPRRRSWALGELKSFIRIAEKNSLDVFSVKGSTAGAFGLAQFIPSSYLSFAVDGDGDGVVDLFNEADAVLSIARYLAAHGWGDEPRDARKALLAYNRSNPYVDAILAYAKAVAGYMSEPPKR